MLVAQARFACSSTTARSPTKSRAGRHLTSSQLPAHRIAPVVGTRQATMDGVVTPKPEKIGAGVLLCCGSEVLVLLRNSRHNNNTWGLPGGNADAADGDDLLTTAKREAIEEMANLPDFVLKGKVLTVRGKRNQKHYTVFLCEVTPEAKAAYKPQLNEEHSQWQWFDINELKARDDLHPVVASLLHDHWPQTSSWLSLSTPVATPQ